MSEGINIQNDEEIQKALKDFEVKSETDAERRVNQDLEPQKASSMADLVMKHSRGNIKDLRHAEYVLLGFVIVAMVVSFFIFFYRGSKGQKTPDILIEQMKQIQTFPTR